jgi:hypothetical protein
MLSIVVYGAIAVVVVVGVVYRHRMALYEVPSGRKGYAAVVLAGIVAAGIWTVVHPVSTSQKTAQSVPAKSGPAVPHTTVTQPAASPVANVPVNHHKEMVHKAKHAKAVKKPRPPAPKKAARRARQHKKANPPVASQSAVQPVVHHYYRAPSYVAPPRTVYRPAAPPAVRTYMPPPRPSAPAPVVRYHPVAPDPAPPPAKPSVPKRKPAIWSLGG